MESRLEIVSQWSSLEYIKPEFYHWIYNKTAQLLFRHSGCRLRHLAIFFAHQVG